MTAENIHIKENILPMIRRIYPELLHPAVLIWEDEIPNKWLKNDIFYKFIKDKTTVRKDKDHYKLYHNHVFSKTISYPEYMILKGLDPSIVNLDEINIEEFN